MQSSERTYMMVNKKVGVMDMLSLSDNSFTKDDVNEFKKQDFISDVGEITASSCRIWAFRDTEPLKFKTDMFFEGLDDRFIDKKPREWHWDEEDDFVPVMVNADFLNLYNFAFAKTQNLPQFTTSTVSQFTVLLEVRGNGEKRLFKARIVDVSDRIPSVIAPLKFVNYINNTFGKPDEGKYSRLMLKVTNPSDPKLIDYLAQRDIVANEDILSSGKSKSMLAKVLAGEISLAFILVLLAAIIVVITFELMISNSRKDIELLKNLGFHSKSLLDYFSKKFLILSSIQLFIALCINVIIGYYVKLYIESIGYEDISILSLNALLSFVGIGFVYFIFFRRRISKTISR
jgi:ABC-type antimicrobial peptide transport system permease subunit